MTSRQIELAVERAEMTQHRRHHMTVKEMKARIDPVALERTRARLRRRGTKRVIKSIAGAVGTFVLATGAILGLGAAGTSMVRSEIRRRREIASR